jgi:SAM-dependent methyltransferase
MENTLRINGNVRLRVQAMFVTLRRIILKTGRITWNLLTLSDAAKGYPDAAYLRIWRSLPSSVQTSRFGYNYGRFIYKRSRMRQKRDRCEYTRFLRLRPQLEIAQRIAVQMPQGASIRMAVLGCSSGAEMYSFLWGIRSARPDLRIVPVGVDISSSALDVARAGTYSSEAKELQGLSEQEVDSLFVRDGESLKVRNWIREGATWINADACDPKLIEIVGYQDIVVANNFLIHLFPPEDEASLRNIVGLVVPEGYIFTHGVDIDVRRRVARDLGLIPIPFKIEEQHNTMDSEKLTSWPQHWSSREPFDRSLTDWELRYSTVFQIPSRR